MKVSNGDGEVLHEARFALAEWAKIAGVIITSGVLLLTAAKFFGMAPDDFATRGGRIATLETNQRAVMADLRDLREDLDRWQAEHAQEDRMWYERVAALESRLATQERR